VSEKTTTTQDHISTQVLWDQVSFSHGSWGPPHLEVPEHRRRDDELLVVQVFSEFRQVVHVRQLLPELLTEGEPWRTVSIERTFTTDREPLPSIENLYHR